MSNPQNHVHPAHLLERTAWLKELARALVTDEARADDLVQQTLLQSIEKPGTQGTLAPSWFAKVLRNFAYKTHREERNRKRREQAVARRERLSVTPAEITERAELHREIVDLVLQLDEPYRSTVLFRYFQGLNLREIAEQERTPITTVRSRLRNALEQLRVRLDGKCGGERQAWQAAY